MAEIYRDSSATLSLGLDTATAVSAVITRDGVTIATPAIQTGNSFVIPFSIVGFDGPFTVVWTFTYQSITATRQETHEIVTPYVTVAEIRDALTLPTAVTDTQLIRLERRYRKIIESICNQEFGLYQDTKDVIGKADVNLQLPERLVSFSTVAGPNVVTDPTLYNIRGDGFYLTLSAEAAQSQDFIFSVSGGTVITAPPVDPFHIDWLDGYKYTITGLWGYEAVPANIKEAMLILIEQAVCPDSTYRERYIEDVSYADSTYSFNSAAFSPMTTGNATADSLIAEYVRVKFTVI